MARVFPGSNGNYLPTSVADPSVLDITGVYLTLCAWVKKANTGVSTWVISKENASPTSSQYRLTCSTVVEGIVCDAGGFDQVAGATTIPVGSWHHIAVVKDGTGTGSYRAYLDGKLDGVATSTRTIQNTALQIYIGTRGGDGVSMNGALAHVAAWPVALDHAEIYRLATGALPNEIQPRRLAGYWPLDDYLSSPAGGANDLGPSRVYTSMTGAVTYTSGPTLPSERAREHQFGQLFFKTAIVQTQVVSG